MRRLIFILPLTDMLLAGCTADTRDDSFNRVHDTVESRAGYDIARRPAAELADLTGDGTLYADEAVRLALLNNADPQAELDAIGIASAELLQASLLPNPIVNASVRFANEGEIIELGIAQSILQLLLIPGRRSQAREALAMTEAEVAAAVLDMYSETRTAYRRYQAQLARVELFENVVDATYLAADMARRLRGAGIVIARQAVIRSFETLVPDLEIGADAERETNGDWSVGPAGQWASRSSTSAKAFAPGTGRD